MNVFNGLFLKAFISSFTIALDIFKPLLQSFSAWLFTIYCNKLIELGLVQGKRAAIQGKVRQFTVEG